MPLEIRKLSCPRCGASLEVLNARRTKTLVCRSCGSQLDLTDPALQVVANLTNVRATPRTPISLGMWGQFRGKQWQVIGRVRYREEGAFWDEWLLMTEEGELLWLTEGEEGFTLYDPIVPREPTDPETVGLTLTLDGTRYPVRARGIGTIDYLEGELTWKATRGDQVRYLDAQLGQTKAAIEWTPSEIEFFRGEKLPANAVRQAFGLPLLRPDQVVFGSGRPSLLSALVLAVIVFICVCGCLASSITIDEREDGSVDIAFVPFAGASPGAGSGFGGTSRSGGGTRSGSGGSSRSGGGGGGK
ncbi:MAG: DUF4178 domain-containing protein [Chloroflexota bacterium]|nr:DUF4178 domain-containing protein [Dehalococcoidia bacterium]MDW8254059.1 DUF4178 domain-containing protein [Chloroflexota bacterium]